MCVEASDVSSDIAVDRSMGQIPACVSRITVIIVEMESQRTRDIHQSLVVVERKMIKYLVFLVSLVVILHNRYHEVNADDVVSMKNEETHEHI